MNAIGAFSARLNGVRRGYPAKMSSRQEQKTPSSGLSGTHSILFASEEAAQRWLDEHDPESVAFEYLVQE